VSVDAGFFHSCGLTALGEAYCWGTGSRGEFGDGSFSSASLPVPAATGLALAGFEAGTLFSCGIEANGTGYCWGGFNNFVGQHGTGSRDNSNVPVAIAGSLSFAAVEAHNHNNITGVNCGITTTGAAYCWGNDGVGQVGNGAAADVCPTASFGDIPCENAPAAVAGGLTFDEVSVGSFHVCGLTSAGELYCWGWNEHGQLGDGSKIDSDIPVRVATPAGG
jgi:alpha-tubulin suppressor-like RCC1 family protein